MAIDGIPQPEFIPIDDALRLRRFDGQYDFALPWYQDPEMVYLVDGERKPYTPDLLARMYSYLDHAGELYFIEAFEDGAFRPIGDVTFWQEDMPIVIGDPRWRGKGVGRRVISVLVAHGKAPGYSALYVREIYDFNIASRKCFESVGFRRFKDTEKGASYVLNTR